jgi:hypothetical protein
MIAINNTPAKNRTGSLEQRLKPKIKKQLNPNKAKVVGSGTDTTPSLNQESMPISIPLS